MPESAPSIPRSPALAEARVDSLSELYSRDPEGYSQRDLDRIIEDLRGQRTRWVVAEAEARDRPKGVAARAKTLVAGTNAEDLGL